MLEDILESHLKINELIENISKGKLKMGPFGRILNSSGLPSPYYNQVIEEHSLLYRKSPFKYSLISGTYYFFHPIRFFNYYKSINKLVNLMRKKE